MPIFSKDIGIDLGTATTLVYVKGQGIVLNEASFVAVDTDKKKVIAAGDQAKQMLGKTPPYIQVIRPLKDGVIADFEMAEQMLSYFINKALKKTGLIGPRIVIGVPSEATEVEKRAVEDVALNCGARQAYVIEESMASALGAGLLIEEPTANMVVDIGGGTTEISIISLAGISTGTSIRNAGDAMDQSIVNYVRKSHALLIGLSTAEKIKKTIGSAKSYEGEMPMMFKGRDLVTGLPKTMTIEPEEVREALSEHVTAILDSIRQVLERTAPELASDVSKNGICLTGGGSKLKGLDEYLYMETGIKTTVMENPLECAAIGTGKVIEKLHDLSRVIVSYKK